MGGQEALSGLPVGHYGNGLSVTLAAEPRSRKWARLAFRVGNKSTIAICLADYLCPREEERARDPQTHTSMFLW